MRSVMLLAICGLLVSSPTAAAEAERPRLVVLTDIGGDPDDQQSLIRLMLYANEFEIEGLIATAAGTPGELKEAVTRPDLIRQIALAYGKVQPNLARHDERYPPAEKLLALIKTGNKHRGQDFIGEKHDTEGSQWIISRADADDERPLCITIWGGQTDFAQALWRVRNDRGEEGLKKFMARLRVYDIDDQDGIQKWIFANFPDLFYVLAKSQPGRDKREGAYRGMYLGGDQSLTSLAWLKEHALENHGPLGALYPTQTWTAPNPHGAMKEGDTPSWFYFLPSALSDPAHPEWGGWGGRFKHAERGLWRDVPDVVDGKPDTRGSVWRWRPQFAHAFQARLDWCVKSPEEANHPPVILIDGQEVRRPLVKKVKAGSRISFTARSRDRDDDKVSYRWSLYADA
ncbi:MAG TPA: DUF1593 domain-containing protein, partial [Pirellulaceae bacterium]|nr:DUF1593 domain-containing protein [Pirellulaceae bacterium]